MPDRAWPAAVLLSALLLVGAPAAADCRAEAERSVQALLDAGVLEAQQRATARAVLAKRCVVEDEDARTEEVLGMEFRRADPDSAGNKRLGKRR